MANGRQEDNKLILGFRDNDKMDGTPNETLPLVITDIIEKHSVSVVHIDNGSFCSLMYIEIFMRLHDQYLKLYEGGNMLEFADSSTLPCGTIELPVVFKEGMDKKIVDVYFLMIPW